MRVAYSAELLRGILDACDPLPPVDSSPPPTAIDTLYRRNAKRLLSFFSRRASPEEAPDLLHDTFARFAALDENRRAQVDIEDAYLSSVATNILRDRARAAARRALRRIETAEAESVDAVDPHGLLEHRDALRRLEHAVDLLPSRRRRIFLLHRLENLTYAEIACEVGMSEKGVKKQMAKALFELRSAMGPL